MAKTKTSPGLEIDPRGGTPREKCETKITGLDTILNGGLPLGNTVFLKNSWLFTDVDVILKGLFIGSFLFHISLVCTYLNINLWWLRSNPYI